MNKYRIWFINERGQTEKLKTVSLSLEESDLFTFGSIVRLFEKVEHNSAMVNGLEVTEVHNEKVLEKKKIFKPGDRVIYIGGNRKPPRRELLIMALFTRLALAALFLTVVPVGMATVWLGFVRGDSPCVMCWEQRIGMLLIALTGLFVLLYGPKPKYIGMAVLIAGWGMFMGMRHVGMHDARDIGQGFSLDILGAHTYTWALFTYWVCVLVMGALLLMVRDGQVPAEPRTLRDVERLAGGAFLLVVAAHDVQAFASTGPPPFVGQSDPVRFSFNPRHWHWSLEEWQPARISLQKAIESSLPSMQALRLRSMVKNI